MNPKGLIRLDKLFYFPYTVLRLFTGFFRSPKQSDNQSFVLLKFFGIGSITRIIHELKKHNVDLDKATFITFSSNREVCGLLGIPNVQYVQTSNWFGTMLSMIKMISQIRSRSVKHVIDFERSSNITGIISLFSLKRSTKLINFNLSNKDDQDAVGYAFSLQNRSFKDLIDLTSQYLPKTNEPNQVIKNVRSSNAVLININASDYLKLRKYPIHLFVEIIHGLRDMNSDIQIDLIGAAHEREYVNELMGKLLVKDGIYNRCGEWNLQDLYQNLKSSRLLITNDSGPMHLAVQAGIDTIALWGPTSPSKSGYTDVPNMHNVYSKRACSPCFIHPKSKAGKECSYQGSCMTDIKPQEVIDLAYNILIAENSTVLV